MVKKGQKEAASEEKDVAPNHHEPKYKDNHFASKILFLVSLMLIAYTILSPQNTEPTISSRPISLSPPKINEGETRLSSEASNIISDFIIPESANLKPEEDTEISEFNDDQYLNKATNQKQYNHDREIITDNINDNNQEIEKIYNHIQYLEQKIKKLEEQTYGNKAVIEREYRTILSLALKLDKKIQTGEPYNREIILLQLETDDIFINGKIANISEQAVSGTHSIVELHQSFVKTRMLITEQLQEELTGNSAFAETFNGFVSIKRKHKIPDNINEQFNLIEAALTANDLISARQYLNELPQRYQSLAANFAHILEETIVIRKSVNDILKYLDV